MTYLTHFIDAQWIADELWAALFVARLAGPKKSVVRFRLDILGNLVVIPLENRVMINKARSIFLGNDESSWEGLLLFARRVNDFPAMGLAFHI